MINIRQFKSDFLEADLLNILQQNFEVILVWIAGSVLTGVADPTSDVDLGVLIADDTDITQKERNENFLIYKPTNTKIQWIYDTVKDITTLQVTANQRNIGWAQLRLLDSLKDDHILYINPKYVSFVQNLIHQKESISRYSMWLYFNTKQNIIKNILTAGQILPSCRVKSLYHLCWMSDILNENYLDLEFLKLVKHISTKSLSEAELNIVFEKIKALALYFSQVIPEKPDISLKECGEVG